MFDAEGSPFELPDDVAETEVVGHAVWETR